MAWGAEAAEHDIPRALALSAVALLAVFPEYAVDFIFAFKAGQDPPFAPFAAANMTGSNRLLLGLGWSMVSVLAWISRREHVLHLERDADPAAGLSGHRHAVFVQPPVPWRDQPARQRHPDPAVRRRTRCWPPARATETRIS